MIEKLNDGIFSITIPFEDIYTTAFVLAENRKAAIVDIGSSAVDAEKYIIPEITRLGLTIMENLKGVGCNNDKLRNNRIWR